MESERIMRKWAQRRGWDDFFVVTDASGGPTAIRVATARRDFIRGFAFGHAALSRSTEGDRAPERREIWDHGGALYG